MLVSLDISTSNATTATFNDLVNLGTLTIYYL